MNNTDTILRENNRFQILNENWLDGYPLPAKEESAFDNSLQLDRTGEYLVVGKEKKNATPKSSEEDKEGEKLFRTNAFLFWEKKDLIYSDCRMFLARVPVQNGLAYSGTSGFQWPTLGVYLEWWERCEQAHFTDSDGMERLIWFISGSPLSGSNACASVDKDGNSKTTPVSPFRSVWKSFVIVNTRYDEIKPLYEAYTLEEVIDLLTTEHS